MIMIQNRHFYRHKQQPLYQLIIDYLIYHHGHRSAIKLIVEGDASPALPMILCVSDIINDKITTSTTLSSLSSTPISSSLSSTTSLPSSLPSFSYASSSTVDPKFSLELTDG